jgi:uncharacterized protein YqeY
VRIIKELEAKGMQDMGRVMKAAMAELANSADGKVVNGIVRRELSS